MDIHFVPAGTVNFRPSNLPRMLTRQLTNQSLCYSWRDLEQLVKKDNGLL